MAEDKNESGFWGRLEKAYPDAVAMDWQPAWTRDLPKCDDSIERAYVRKDAMPDPSIEMVARDGGGTSYHRIAASEDVWYCPDDDPPGVAVEALEWVRENIRLSDFKRWQAVNE